MSHRVISGSAKGRHLKQVPGNVTRPIMDRVKEALFNILGSGVVDARILDLFAGTGAVGIEALSRGASWATFCDTDSNAIKTIYENLKTTDFIDLAEVIRIDAFAFLTRQHSEPYSLVYIAPPQYAGLWKRTLLEIDTHPHILEPDAVLVVQIDPKEQETVNLTHLHAYDERTYGNTLLWFFEYELPSSDGETEKND